MNCSQCGRFMKKNREGFLIECGFDYCIEWYCEKCNHYMYEHTE